MVSLSFLLFSALLALAIGQPAQAQVLQPIVVEKFASAEVINVGEVVSFTIKVSNSSDTVASVTVIDQLPEGTAPELSRVEAIPYDPTTNILSRTVQVAPGQPLQFVIPVAVKACRPLIINKVAVFAAPNGTPVGDALSQAQAQVIVRCPDLGDAPDDTNHFAAPMTAYPAVAAHYPSVFDPGTGAPQGPRHHFPRTDAWLGGKVSGERDADLFPDEDLVRNIDPPANVPDHDNYDDGIVRWPLVKDCVPTDMAVQVTVPATSVARDRYINVWIDWNQDGDWQDIFDKCGAGALVGEWVVRDFLTNLGPGVHVINLPAFLPLQPANPQQPNHWLRVTLSEDKATQDVGLGRADGRGPPLGFRFGETEDYIARFEQPAAPHLEMVKQADVTHAGPGDVIEYTIAIFNNGNAPASGVLWQDAIPAGTTYVPGSLTANAPTPDDSNTALMKWTGTIPAGGSVIIKFKVRVNPQVPCDGVIRNHAQIVGPNGQELLGADAFVKIRCPGQPVLDIKKEANKTSAAPGDEIEYTITIANGGTAAATGVTMIDPIPAGTTYVPGTLIATAPTTDDSNPSQMKWTGNIPAGGNVVIKFKVVVNKDAPCGSVIENRAAIVNATGQIVLAAGAVVKVECQHPELRIEKKVDKNIAQPSDTLEYTIVIANVGNAPAIGVIMLDPIPANTTYVAGSLTASAPTTDDTNPSLMKWTGNLPVGGSVTITFKVTVNKDVPCPFVVQNKAAAAINANASATDVANPTATPGTIPVTAEAHTLIPCPDQPIIDIKKEANVTHVGLGGEIEYTITINNSGSVAATGVTMIDPIPAGTTFVVGSESATAPAVVYDAGNNWVKWGGNIPAGGSVVIKFKVKVDDKFPCDGLIINRAALIKVTGEVQQVASNTVKIDCGEPKLEIVKRANVTQTVPGGEIEYTIVINNFGTGPALGVNMIDFIPAGTNYVFGSVNATAPTASYDAGLNAIKWNGNIPAGGNVVIKFKVRVDPDATCQEAIVNRALLQMNGAQLTSNPVFVKVDCQPGEPAIAIKKWLHDAAGNEVDNGEIQPGGSTVYYLSLASTNGLSYTVHMSDDMPSGIVAVAASASSPLAQILAGGASVVWDGVVGPANSPVIIKIQVRATDKLPCDSNVINVAHWFARGSRGSSNPVTLGYRCPNHDLGDAPDSSNHPNAKMSAYPAVQANYPTVFDIDPATGRGPKHLAPRPFHLGKGVSGEIEADQGFDQDAINNILPSADKANLDKADDGVLLSSISFKHCQRSEIKVLVAIDPAAIAMLNGKGYLNVWVDSNRDGDWADRFDCANATGTAGEPALEHIVIDYVVDAATLGAGFHTLTVPTSVPVAWPDDMASRPAWLRASLSERPSEKIATVGAISYGDGRGPNDPFRLGETEDYILSGVTQQVVADPSVNKRGEIWPDYDPATQTRRWVVGWVVNYNNAGPSAANNVHVIESFDLAQTLIAEHSIPLVPHTGSNPLDYNVGTLPAGGSGLVIVRTSAAWNTPPGTVLTNTATIRSDNDGNNLNNTSVATVTVPILPPLITGPLAGSTCTTTVTVTGQAQPGVQVELYVDNVLVSTLPTNAAGEWSTVLNLAVGSHDLHAIAKMGALTSDPSPTVTIIVDPTLFWDPISLRFTSDDGHVIIPSGRLDETGWSIFLRPGHTYTVTLRVCCESPTVVTMQLGDITVTLSDPDNDHIFTGVFTIPVGGRFTGDVRICVTCNLIRRCSDGTVLIDPEGTVFDLTTGSPINAATVSCLQENSSAAGSNGGGPIFALWDAKPTDQVNPQSVKTDGYFSFFTPAGTFRLDVTKSGYQDYTSPDLVVVDTPVHHDVPLTPKVDALAGQQIAVTDSGFEPSVVTVQKGTVIEWINAGEDVHSSTSVTPSVSFEGAVAAEVDAGSNGWDSGLLDTGESYKRQLNTVGTYTYQDVNNPDATATIIVVDAPVVTPDRKVFLPVVSKQ